MRTMDARLLFTMLFGMLLGLWCAVPGRAFPLTPPSETLAGLTPGVSSIADASRMFGVYDTVLSGDFAQYVGGPRAMRGYRWTTGLRGHLPGLIAETRYGTPRIDLVVVDEYPGLATGRGLMALQPESQVLVTYGYPDYAYELTFDTSYGPLTVFRELFYINQGLVVVLVQVSGRPNWTVTKILLTYPTYLRNAVALRTRYAIRGEVVEDITNSYRVWAQMAVAPAP